MRPTEDPLDTVAPEFEDIGPINAAIAACAVFAAFDEHIAPARLRT